MSKKQAILKDFHSRLALKMTELNIKPDNLKLYEQAFSHSSFINDFKMEKLKDNERLEFLGDAVLELVVSQYLFREHSDMSEGKLTKLRAAIVCEPSLVTFANKLEFSRLILLGKGEEKTGGRNRPSLIADVFEAFIGALFLDLGFEAAVKFADLAIIPHINEELLAGILDHKTFLQEYLHQQGLGQIVYRLVEENGPAHHKEFTSEVVLDTKVIGRGTGRTKKESEQQAARIALETIQLGV
ncbi:ribonuclease III [Macrococcus equipercicus]|uniref:Ribonuclease 3 n=1 Tax=Macrococcus equipercicus TaxID=69967 RepID=A0A9Q9F200_9STAP|nr:ribonuclease III [Macrococcus equipercicus]KAA1042772.1 ribonuclease III [Macrococcus equipercicus]UTH14638.1 ribonuclease III [Macrococcus equipercicus]